MTGYLLRRLLFLIPTFFGILIINFAVLRLQGGTLAEELSQGTGEAAGERRQQAAAQRYENYLDRFRRSGNDLPVLINLRGFLTKADLEADLRALQPGSGLKDSERNRREKDLWLLGPAAVRPLAEILADPALAALHPMASQALTLCAYTSVEPRAATTLPPPVLTAIQERNRRLRELVMDPRDPVTADANRQALVALAQDPAYNRDDRWRNVLLHTGFTDFCRRLVTGDLYSETKKRYVFEVIAERWSVTFWLNTSSILIAWAVAVPLGIRSARRVGSLEDRVTTESLFVLWSVPSFFVGTLLLHHFCTADAGGQAWFPNKGLSSPDSLWWSTPAYLLDVLWHAALPLVTLSYASFVSLSRYLRADLLEQLHADYIRTARAKGADDDRVVYHHALPNSSLTMITLSAGLLSELFSGVLLVELIFSINGLGWLLLDAALQRDAPLIMGATVIQVGLLLVGILIADLLYAVADPRIRSRYA